MPSITSAKQFVPAPLCFAEPGSCRPVGVTYKCSCGFLGFSELNHHLMELSVIVPPQPASEWTVLSFSVV